MSSTNLPAQPLQTIPKKIHMIWIGDETKCPHQWMQTWRDHHPTWDVKLWGNAELENIQWRSKTQMDIYRMEGQWAGVADLMRYEILLEHGGVYVDADTICIKPLDDWLLDTRMFALWEHEVHRPGLIANSYIGAIPNHPALKAIVKKTARMCKPSAKRLLHKPYWKGRLRFNYEYTSVWQAVGPLFFTRMLLPFCPMDVTILPSVLFMPQHYLDKEKRQSSLVYAHQMWGTTKDVYATEYSTTENT
jgi:mannosyltransferase OCH1-like enzyme